MKIKFKRLSPGAQTPQRMSTHASGFDLFANCLDSISLAPGDRAKVSTGFAIEIPAGYEAQIRPRSGMALKHGIGVLNSPGTIDADYRGEVCVILINLSSEPFTISNGMRIAQMVISQVLMVELEECDELNTTARHDGGFGHTGA